MAFWSHGQSSKFSIGQPTNNSFSQGQLTSTLFSEGQPTKSSKFSIGQPTNTLFSEGQPTNTLFSEGQPTNTLFSEGQPTNTLFSEGQPTNTLFSKGQIPYVCQLCEISINVTKQCMECKLEMCQRCCDKVHPKFPSAKDHTMIDIGKYEKNSEEDKTIFSNLLCNEHSGKKCCHFCKSCNHLVCYLCIGKAHKFHKLTEITHEFESKKEILRKSQKKIDTGIHTQTCSGGELRKIEFLEHASFNKTRQEILEYKEALSKAVNEHANELLEKLCQCRDKVSKSVNQEQKKVKQNLKFLLNQKEVVKNILKTNDARTVLTSADTLMNTIERGMGPVNTTFQHVPKFSPGTGKLSDLQKLFGSLKNVTSPYNPEPKVIGEYCTSLNLCYNLHASRDGSMWLNDQTILKKVVPTHNDLKILMNFNCFILNMSQMTNGDLILTVIGSSILKIIPFGTTELKDSCYDVSPLQPFGVHATQDNKVIISVFDKESIKEVVQRKVIVMNQTGLREKVFENDCHNKPLFTIPRRLISNNCNIIGVIDLLSEDLNASSAVFSPGP
ncbi:ATDC [Mytilus edulis]|uniref:TRIM29 n=1 Tax=Mytilus edulis TaxID=6550 RepID=A0A8S3Q3T9_MYTED|nr:ATDC [Mytilus edulis]